MSKKKITLIALAVCLIAILSMATLAWFTDEDAITNEFYVGDSTTDPDEVFGIDLWETSDKNGDGQISDDEIYGKDTKDDQGVVYETILPGEILDKDPYFTNTGIHGQYLRAIVTVTEADILKEAMIPKGSDVSEWYKVELLLPGTDPKWSLEYTYHTNKDTFVFVYYYNEVLAGGATTEKLFDDVVIPTELTKEQAAEMESFNINIVGQVIQNEHLVDVTNAKEAFAKYWDEPGIVAGVAPEDLAPAGGTVAVSYPVTGNLGTIKSDLIAYDDANYAGDGGVLWFTKANATVKSGVNLVTVPAAEVNGTVVFDGAEFTVEDGGVIVKSECTTVVYIMDLTINGEKVTSANMDAMAKYFPGCTLM